MRGAGAKSDTPTQASIAGEEGALSSVFDRLATGTRDRLRGRRAGRHYRPLGDCLPTPGPGGLPCASRPPCPQQPVDKLRPAVERRCIRAGTLRPALLFGVVALPVRHSSAPPPWRPPVSWRSPSRLPPSPLPPRTAGTCACRAGRPARSTSPPPRGPACRWTWRPTARGSCSTCWGTSTGCPWRGEQPNRSPRRAGWR